MQDLGLSQLNNDQLLELIEQVVQETVRRGGHILAATNIQFTNCAEELQDLANNLDSTFDNNPERRKAAIISALTDSRFFQSMGYTYDRFSLNIWDKNGGDKRLYIQQSFTTDGWKITYYHDGNRWHHPHTIESNRQEANLTSLIPFCQFICERESAGFKCYPSKELPDPNLLKIYQGILSIIN
jgi:hypothetical protein